MAKAYFIIPNAFDNQQIPNTFLDIYFESIRVNNVEQLTSDYFSEVVPSFISDLKYTRSLNNFQTVSNTQPYTGWNPFYTSLGLTFDTNTFYGTCTGTQSGTDYGYFEDNLIIDRITINDNGGALQYGAFAFEYDDTKNFYFRLKVISFDGRTTTNETISAGWNASTGATFYNGLLGSLDTFGWINNTGQVDTDTQGGNVNKYIAEVLSIPQIDEDDRGYNVCCPNTFVFASTNDASSEKNDIFGAYHEKKKGEGVEWVVEQDGIIVDVDALVDIKDFDNLQTFTFNWRDIILSLGTGEYQVKKEIRVNGILLYTFNYPKLKLMEFSYEFADGTTRILSEFNNKFEGKLWTFKDTEFKHSMRVKGSFSNEQYEVVNENNINTNFNIVSNYRRIESTHTLEISGIRDCIWQDIPNLMLLADEIKITDYNQRNYTYKYKDFRVELESWEQSEYTPNNRLGIYRLTFKDKEFNKISKYDG